MAVVQTTDKAAQLDSSSVRQVTPSHRDDKTHSLTFIRSALNDRKIPQRQIETKTERKTDREKKRRTDRPTDRQRQRERERDRQTGQREREREREKE